MRRGNTSVRLHRLLVVLRRLQGLTAEEQNTIQLVAVHRATLQITQHTERRIEFVQIEVNVRQLDTRLECQLTRAALLSYQMQMSGRVVESAHRYVVLRRQKKQLRAQVASREAFQRRHVHLCRLVEVPSRVLRPADENHGIVGEILRGVGMGKGLDRLLRGDRVATRQHDRGKRVFSLWPEFTLRMESQEADQARLGALVLLLAIEGLRKKEKGVVCPRGLRVEFKYATALLNDPVKKIQLARREIRIWRAGRPDALGIIVRRAGMVERIVVDAAGSGGDQGNKGDGE